MDDRTTPQRAADARSLKELDDLLVGCRACPRLVLWREKVAKEKRASFADEEYWGRPVPGFGPEDASVLVVGLAPAAHGANRTGRMFTGDRSGDFLFASMYRVGMANQPESERIGDGLALNGVRVTSPVHCAPPGNKPTPEERRTCSPFLLRELKLLEKTLRVVVVLGAFGWASLLSALAEDGWEIPVPHPKFGHGAQIRLRHPDGRELTVIGSYHVSQQNTFTGRLTEGMLDKILLTARGEAAR